MFLSYTYAHVCEAFLRIEPHFVLWLKIFSVKPKVVGGRQAERGGAMVGKMPNVLWLEGSFVETIKGWCRCQNRRISGRGTRTVRLGGW